MSPTPTAKNPRLIPDAIKEAVVDSLLNNMTARLAGEGEFARILYGGKPRGAIYTAFLLPTPPEERTGEEESSPICISAHGLDFQIHTAAAGSELIVQPSGSVYVRILPTAPEVGKGGPLEPSFPVAPEVRAALRQCIREAMAALRNELGEKHWKHPDWQKRSLEARREAHQSVGLPFGDEIVDREPDVDVPPVVGELASAPAGELPAAEELPADETIVAPDAPPEGAADPTVDVTVTGGSGLPDHLVQAVAPPAKWLRLDLSLPEFRFTPANAAPAVEKATAALNLAIRKQLTAWAESREPETGGALWGYRRARQIRPSDLKHWAKYLEDVRASKLPVVLPNIELRWAVDVHPDPADPSRTLVHLALENWSDEPDKSRRRESEESVFQVRLTLTMPAHLHVPLVLDRVKPSYRYNEYLAYPALGFNGGVQQLSNGDSAVLQTTWSPRYTLPRVIAVDRSGEGVLAKIAKLAREDCIPGLKAFIPAYEKWLTAVGTLDVERGIPAHRNDLKQREHQAHALDVINWRRELSAVSVGIDLLEHSRTHWSGPGMQKDPRGIPFEAWLAMNTAMAEIARQKDYEDWRLFQLAFILASLPAFATRIPEFQSWYTPDTAAFANAVTVLYFATGGGKSEAFLGVLLFNLFLDRLRGKERGITAMLRYPLRLLTLQQAQRTVKALAQAELVRRGRNISGESFTLGFWVGGSNTPNWLSDPDVKGSVFSVDEAPLDSEPALLNKLPYQRALERWRKLVECPFCGGSAIALRLFPKLGGLLGHVCLGAKCSWNAFQANPTPLPFYIVDEDIYDYAPSVLLGTVDKLAMLGQSQATIRKFLGMFGLAPWWEPANGRLHVPRNDNEWKAEPGTRYQPLFPTYSGGAKRFFDPFPSLLIQDEAHLLDESLGTFAGLFETALDAAFDALAPLLQSIIATEPGSTRRRRVKVIAASATVAEPERQMRSLYQRDNTVQFPYPGPDLYRSFYAEPKAPDDSEFDLERRAIDPANVELRSHWGRVYASILTNGHKHTVTTVATLANHHVQLTGLYERFRSGDPTQEAEARALLIRHLSPGPLHAQFARVLGGADNDTLLTLVDLHRIALTYVTNKKGGDQIIDTERVEFERLHQRDNWPGFYLQSDLITGAIDAGQIGAVVKRAQIRPKPGESFPALNDTLRSVIATSAVSHGVDVEELNAMFFAGMPSDIAEYIQASSRVGRSHVGFCVLVPVPQRARDRFIVEIHDIFHRFLERMILPASVDRWAEKALLRVIPSFFQTCLCGAEAIKELAATIDGSKRHAHSYAKASDVRDWIRVNPGPRKGAIAQFLRAAYGLTPAFKPEGAPYYEGVVNKELNAIEEDIDTARYSTSELRYFFEHRSGGRLRPMTSLRDVDEPGYIVPSSFEADEHHKLTEDTFDAAMHFIRRGSGANIDDALPKDEGSEEKGP